jgi:RHS repeat-associated protein
MRAPTKRRASRTATPSAGVTLRRAQPASPKVRAATAGEHGVEGTRRAKRDGRKRDYTDGGATPEHKNTEKLPYLFTSKELDEETGLYYFGARYYDPRTSVWQSADPAILLMLGGGAPPRLLRSFSWSAYGYSSLNPLRFIDPDGMQDEGAGGASGKSPGGGSEGTSATGKPQKMGTIPEAMEEGVEYAMPLPSFGKIRAVGRLGRLLVKGAEHAGPIAKRVAAKGGRLAVRAAEKAGAVLERLLLGAEKGGNSVEDLVRGSKLGRVTKGRTKQFEKLGGLDQAVKDFEALRPTGVKDISGGGFSAGLPVIHLAAVW